MNNHLVRAALAVTLTLAWTASATATPMFFTNNQAGFNTAVANAGITLNNDGFNDLVGPNAVPPLFRPALTVTVPGGGGFAVATTSNAFSAFVLEGTASLTVTSAIDPITITFNSPINAFSILLGDLDLLISGDDVALGIGGVMGQPLGLPQGLDQMAFLGVVDTMSSYSSVSFSRIGTPTEVYVFDFVQFGALPTDPGPGPGGQIPEPSTILLLGSGLAGLAFWRRKQNRKV